MPTIITTYVLAVVLSTTPVEQAYIAEFPNLAACEVVRVELTKEDAHLPEEGRFSSYLKCRALSIPTSASKKLSLKDIPRDLQ